MTDNLDQPAGRRADRRGTAGSPLTIPWWLPGSSRVDPESEPIFVEVLRSVTRAS